jgi:hypothetical protein
MYFGDVSFRILDDSVKEIGVHSPFYKFTNGLGVGDSEEKIKQAFGDDFLLKETEVKDFLTYEDEGLQFEINKDKRTVMEISVLKTADSLKPPSKSNEQVKGEADKVTVNASLDAARAWLDIVDAGDYGRSWEQAAELLKNAVSKEQLIQSFDAVRSPLGKVISRSISSKTFTKQAPGAPDGQYVIIQFETSFENKTSAIETITPMLDKDGSWRVSGYYIK